MQSIKTKPYGVSRVLNTYGRQGDIDAVIDILDEYTNILNSDASCLLFHYGTVIMPHENDDDSDPFSVWVNEIWTTENARNAMLQKDEVNKLNQKLVQYLEFEPEKGVELDIRGGKFIQNC